MPYYGWHVAAIVVLAVTGSAWFLRRDISGYIGGATWFLLLFLPAMLLARPSQCLVSVMLSEAKHLGLLCETLRSAQSDTLSGTAAQLAMFVNRLCDRPDPSRLGHLTGGIY